MIKQIKYNIIINRINNDFETSERRDFIKPCTIISYQNSIFALDVFIEYKIITITNCLTIYGLCEDELFKIMKNVIIEKLPSINFNDYMVKRNVLW